MTTAPTMCAAVFACDKHREHLFLCTHLKHKFPPTIASFVSFLSRKFRNEFSRAHKIETFSCLPILPIHLDNFLLTLPSHSVLPRGDREDSKWKQFTYRHDDSRRLLAERAPPNRPSAAHLRTVRHLLISGAAGTPSKCIASPSSPLLCRE